MNVTITPSSLRGSVSAVASKSMAHRLMILNALSPEPGEFVCATTSLDIEATRECLVSLLVARAGGSREPATLDCGESGSTLRFLLPVAGALGVPARFVMHGRLAKRPLAPLDEKLRAHGMRLRSEDGGLVAEGLLHGGRFTLPGDISSQYVSGLLLASPMLDEACEVWVRKPVGSRPYVSLTIRALERFGIPVECASETEHGTDYEVFRIAPSPLCAPQTVVVEGDWSNAAFWLAAGALEPEGVTVCGLDLQSPQGDRAVLAALSALGARIARRGNAARATMDTPRAASMDVGAIPDLVPPLAAVAATTPGTTRLRNAGRLRLKESDRLASVTAAINALGGRASASDDELVIEGVGQLHAGTVDSVRDHRIAMMAAVMATHATGPVTIAGAECVTKSYPTFWDDYAALGGMAKEEL